MGRYRIHFIGMMRSGNHAVINFIRENFSSPELIDSRSIHFNNVLSLMETPQRALGPEQLRVNNAYENYMSVISYEEIDLEYLISAPAFNNDQTILENSERRVYLLLRNPFECFASRLQKVISLSRSDKLDDRLALFYWKDALTRTSRLWKQYAHEFAGDTNTLGSNKLYRVDFNLWRSDVSYRKWLMRDFDVVNYKDLGINSVSGKGDGSSFYGTDYDGKASEMRNDSWKDFISDPNYECLFDSEIIALSERIFGHVQGSELLAAGRPLSKSKTHQ